MRDPAELRKRAQVAARSGDIAAARTLLVKARALAADDPEMTALIGATSAYVDAEQYGAQTGLAVCRGILDTPGLSATTRGTVWSQIGLLHMRAGEREQALEAYTHAVPLLQDEPETLGRAHLNRANVHLYRHDPRSAIADLTVARDKFELVGQRGDLARVEHNLGYAHLLLGDLLAALEWMDRALDTAAPVPFVLQSVFAQDRAEVLLAAGRVSDAASTLEVAAAAYGSQRLRRFQAEAEFVLARTLLHDEPRRAREVARQAARRFRTHESVSWAVRCDALAAVAEISEGGRAPSLRDRADRLADQLREHGNRRDAEVLALHAARLAVRRGELDDARDRLQRIRISASTPIGTRLLDREVRAELARARGHAGRALAHVRAGLDDLHAWQSSFGSLDLQSTLVGHGNHLARLGLTVALESNDPATLFEWSERARALASRVAPVRPPPDPQLAADLAELRMLGDEDPRRRRALRDRIRQQSWYGEGSGAVGQPVALADLQSTLGEVGAALIAHIALGDELTALVVTRETATVVPLGPANALRDRLDRIAADLDFAARNHGKPFAESVRRSLKDDLDAVAEQLVAPVLDLVGDDRVVLTPSVLLAGTPWTLIPGLSGRPLTVPPSASRWRELVSAPARPLRRIGLVAGPQVPRAEEEVTRAAAAWDDVDVLVGADAATAKVGELAATVDLLHVAGHGVHGGEHPLFSAVDLADGPWFGHDLDLLDTVPAVVVLSACELGQVSVHAEESVGMSAAWLHAGARTVISSPALIADELACEVLAAWHQLVAAGVPPADALAQVCAQTDEVVPLLSFGAGW